MKIFKHPLLGLLLGIALAGGLVQATTYYNQFGPATGILKGSTTTPATTAAVASDVIGLWSGTCNSGTFLRADGSCQAVAVPSGANPSASVGLTAVNGVATTFLRSDGAPAINQAITPTWTGTHTFTQTGVGNFPIVINDSSAGGALLINATDSTPADNFSIALNGDTSFFIIAGGNSANGGTCVTNGATAPYWCLSGQGNIPLSIGTNGIERIRIAGTGAVTVNAPASGVAFTVTGDGANAAAQRINAGTTTQDFVINGLTNGRSIVEYDVNGASRAFYGVNAGANDLVTGSTASAGILRATANIYMSANGGTNHFDILSTGQILGVGANAAAMVDMSPDTGSTTITGTGFSANPTGTMKWARQGNLVCASLPQLTGTSNSASFTITDSPSLPASALPATAGVIMAFGADNSAVTNIVLVVNTSNSPLFTLGKNTAAGGGFTTSGTKTLSAAKACWTTN